MPTKFSMKAFPSSKDSGNSLTGLAAAKARLELQPQQIFDLLAERRDPTDEELELIEMRYHQALALMLVVNPPYPRGALIDPCALPSAASLWEA
jgi:hypothetical protein